MAYEDRAAIVKALSQVDFVLPFDDGDESAFDLIVQCKNKMSTNVEDTDFVFMNGGDRTKQNIPEEVLCKKAGFHDVQFLFGVGGEDKANSSSWILSNWEKPLTKRAWGTYKVLDKRENWVVKELKFDPYKSLSDQRHKYRSEHWHVVSGEVTMKLEYPDGTRNVIYLKSGDSIDIPKGTWHKAINGSSETATVIEVWMGEYLDEKDITRRDGIQ